MEMTDIIEDRLSITLPLLEEKRSGITLRMITESQSQLGYTTVTTDLEKLHVGLHAAVKLCRAALDLYQEELSAEQADDVRRQYQERIQFLKEKIAQLQAEWNDVNAQLIGDSSITPPCFDIEKSGDDDT